MNTIEILYNESMDTMDERPKASLSLRLIAGLTDLVILVLFLNACYFLMKWSLGWWLGKIPGRDRKPLPRQSPKQPVREQ